MSSNFSKDVDVSTPSVVAETPVSEPAKPAEVAAPAAPAAHAAPVHADTLYVLSMSTYLGPDYVMYVDDVMRMVTIQCIIQIMYFMRDPSLGALINTSFLELVFYIVLGVSFYWLVVRKLVRVI
jgi:hypothetical protein